MQCILLPCALFLGGTIMIHFPNVQAQNIKKISQDPDAAFLLILRLIESNNLSRAEITRRLESGRYRFVIPQLRVRLSQSNQ
jgi:hypothetical protein